MAFSTRPAKATGTRPRVQDRRIDSIVAAHAAQRPHRPAIAFLDTELTYAGLEAEIARMADALFAVSLT